MFFPYFYILLLLLLLYTVFRYRYIDISPLYIKIYKKGGYEGRGDRFIYTCFL